MKSKPTLYDVWLLTADTVYKGVPYTTVIGWAEQGRIAGHDKVRPSGTKLPWQSIADNESMSDYLFNRDRRTLHANDHYEQMHAIEMDLPVRKKAEDEDDDVDMIPLIDISLVLLIFFMMTTAVSALSPIDVPNMEYASQMSKDVDAITLIIDKRANDEVYYALRVGDKAVQGEDNNLNTPEEVLQRLDVRLAEAQRPPEVRIACNKELPRNRVRDIVRELEKRKQKDQIAFYGAEVNELKQ